ncbi:MAG: YceI family protein [Candidatus Limnocylindrales bacterium]
MNRNTLIALALVAVVGVGGYLVYDQVLSGDGVAPLALPSATATATGTAAGSTPSTGASSGAGATDAAPGGGAEDVAGTWTVVEGSEAGYRVREQLANLPAESDAVGRTSSVSGSITLASAGEGARLTAGSIDVDTTTIASDESRRDDRMRTEGLQTETFRSATFTVTAPVDIPASALSGEATNVTLTGDLTLHGVTRALEIPGQAQLVAGQIQVAGSLTFALADFEIVAPNVGGFIVSIADQGALEFLLVLAKS